MSNIGVGLRVTGHSEQGGRKYMEDFITIAYQEGCPQPSTTLDNDKKNMEYTFFGVFDGHGGAEASEFARKHLMDAIVDQKLFWSDNDDDVLRAIKEGFHATHREMWKALDKWPKTATGLPSTAGTTASIAFIKNRKLYIGHVGDSGIVLGYQEEGEDFWRARPLTQDHKPECNIEQARITNSGGKVVIKSGVPRVVWNRPRLGHRGPVRRSTPFDEIPFLAVARSLGDLWSYNSALDEFVVSPDPDVQVIDIDTDKFRCLVFGSDGLWNVMSARKSVEFIRMVDEENDKRDWTDWENPSKCLVQAALRKWNSTRMRADNISVISLFISPQKPEKNSIDFCNEDTMAFKSPSNNHHQNGYYNIADDYMYSHPSSEVAMYDHDLHIRVPIPIDNHHHNHQSLPSIAHFDKTNDLCYLNSFSENYNNLYDNSMYVDNNRSNCYPLPSISSLSPHHNHHLRQQQQQQHQQQHNFNVDNNYCTDSYSLTKLQTRNEQMNSCDVNLYPLQFHDYDKPCSSSSSTSDLYSIQPSSYVTNDVVVIDEISSPPSTDFTTKEIIQHHEVECTLNDQNVVEDISIQINEISSSDCPSNASSLDESHNKSSSASRKNKTLMNLNFEPPATRSKDHLVVETKYKNKFRLLTSRLLNNKKENILLSKVKKMRTKKILSKVQIINKKPSTNTTSNNIITTTNSTSFNNNNKKTLRTSCRLKLLSSSDENSNDPNDIKIQPLLLSKKSLPSSPQLSLDSSNHMTTRRHLYNIITSTASQILNKKKVITKRLQKHKKSVFCAIENRRQRRGPQRVQKRLSH